MGPNRLFTPFSQTGAIAGRMERIPRLVCLKQSPVEDREEFVDTPRSRSRGPRGALTGVLMGAGLWCAILMVAGGIRA
ncbi:MAG TPA: hypothetical protein VME43_19230 [Bryobacteraceae bacterium]|nr:hypothetical protein [Bryobacteraceae bacterium]